MKTQQIPRAEWTEFTDRFSRRHAGWLVTLETLDRELGAQELAKDLPLVGVTADREAEGEEITVILAESPARHATHRVLGASRLYLLTNEEGADEALEAEGASGQKMILRFRSPMRPEMVDGLAGEP